MTALFPCETMPYSGVSIPHSRIPNCVNFPPTQVPDSYTLLGLLINRPLAFTTALLSSTCPFSHDGLSRVFAAAVFYQMFKIQEVESTSWRRMRCLGANSAPLGIWQPQKFEVLTKILCSLCFAARRRVLAWVPRDQTLGNQNAQYSFVLINRMYRRAKLYYFCATTEFSFKAESQFDQTS